MWHTQISGFTVLGFRFMRPTSRSRDIDQLRIVVDWLTQMCCPPFRPSTARSTTGCNSIAAPHAWNSGAVSLRKRSVRRAQRPLPAVGAAHQAQAKAVRQADEAAANVGTTKSAQSQRGASTGICIGLERQYNQVTGGVGEAQRSNRRPVNTPRARSTRPTSLRGIGAEARPSE